MELLELPTDDETNDNIVAAWAPKKRSRPASRSTYGYRITALTMDQRLTPAARAVSTFRAAPRALGAAEAPPPGQRAS